MVMKCQHCRKVRAKVLCRRCFDDPAVRARYPVSPSDCRLSEPTEAELDALVAERSKPENLPAWWGCAAGEARLERTSAAVTSNKPREPKVIDVETLRELYRTKKITRVQYQRQYQLLCFG